MSILTWRDVATPDLSGAAYAQAQAQKAMNDAFASANGSINTIKDQRATIADRNIINRVLQYPTAEALQGAMADGSLVGSDGEFAHIDTLKDLPNRVDALIKNSLTQSQVGENNANTGNIQALTTQTVNNTAQTAIDNARKNADDAAWKAHEGTLAGLVQKYTPQGATGLTDATKELEASPTFQALNPTQQAEARKQLYSGIGAPVEAVNALQESVKKGVTERAQTAAENFVRSLSNEKTQEGIHDKVLAIEDPMVRQMVQDHYAQQYPDMFTKPVSTIEMNRGPVGQIRGVDFDPETALFNPNGKYGYKPPPQGWSNTTVAEASKIGDTMKAANSKDVLGGSSAKTQYMMLNGTMERAAQALWKQNPEYFKQQGANNWDQIKLTPQNTEAMAQYTFNQIPKDTDALKKVWVSLKPDDLEVIKQSGFDWNVARPLIIARENGATVDVLANKSIQQQNAQLQAITGNVQKQAANPLVAKYNTYVSANSGADPFKAADFAIANEPALKGMDRVTLGNNIAALIKEVQDKEGKTLTPDQAALALTSSIHDDQLGSGLKRWLHNANDANSDKIVSFEGRHIDLGQARSKAAEILKPDTATEAETLDRSKSALIAAPIAKADFDAKYKTYQQLADAHAKEPNNPEVTKLYAQALANLNVASAYQGVVSRDALSDNPLNVIPHPIPAPAPASTPAAVATARQTAILNQAAGATGGPVNPGQVRMTRIF